MNNQFILKNLAILFILTMGISKYSAQSMSAGNTYINKAEEFVIHNMNHSFTAGGAGVYPGIVGTYRDTVFGHLSFNGTASWSGAADSAHVDGYVKTYMTSAFTFPIGDNGNYQPARVSASSASAPTSAAYFNVSGTTAITSKIEGGSWPILPRGGAFATTAMAAGISAVDNVEYWDINGTTAATITLTWDAASAVSTLTGATLSKLTIVGWNATTSKWEVIASTVDATSILGGSSALSAGSITTNSTLVPNNYSVYTLAAVNTCPLTLTPAPTVTPTDDISCLVDTANIRFKVRGMQPATSYQVSYQKNSGAYTAFTAYTSATDSFVKIPNLGNGSYDSIRVRLASDTTCTVTIKGPWTISAPATPAAGADQSVSCFSTGTATMAATGSGTWTVGAGSAGTATITSPTSPTSTVTGFSAAGTYRMIWTNVSDCKDTAIITVGSSCACPIASNSVSLSGASANCAIYLGQTINGGSATPSGGTYSWVVNSGSGYAAAPGTNNTQNYSTGALAVGTYIFKRVYTITTPTACSDSSNSVSITVDAKPNAGADKSISCFTGGTVAMTASGTATWSAQPGNPGTANIVTPTSATTSINTFTGPGTYYFVWTSASGCKDTASVVVGTTCCPLTVASPPTVSNTNVGSCNVDTAVISIKIKGMLPSTAYNVSYQKNGGASTPFTSFTSGSDTFIRITNLGAGSYDSIRVRSTTDTACMVTLKGPWIVLAPAGTVITDVTAKENNCNTALFDGSIKITATGATQYSIDNGATYQASNTFSGLAPGSYIILVKNAANCVTAFNRNPVVISSIKNPASVITH
jgi:hypothetical protein